MRASFIKRKKYSYNYLQSIADNVIRSGYNVTGTGVDEYRNQTEITVLSRADINLVKESLFFEGFRKTDAVYFTIGGPASFN